MTLGHFIYIPGILLLGIVIGFVLGGRKAELAASEADDLLLGIVIGFVLGGRKAELAASEAADKDQRKAAREARRRARESQ